jgi:hypothetical protein
MKESNLWEPSINIVSTWVRELELEGCVMIVYDDQVEVLKGDNKNPQFLKNHWLSFHNPLLDFTGDAGKKQQEQIFNTLRKLEPRGGTATHDALKKAYEFDIDTILLFTDGEPTHVDGKQEYQEVAESQTHALVAKYKHRNIPINTIGLGNYFKVNKDQARLANFLKKLADDTGGAFIGRYK